MNPREHARQVHRPDGRPAKAVVDDHVLERQQDGLDQDWQVGADQFLEGLREGQDAVRD